MTGHFSLGKAEARIQALEKELARTEQLMHEQLELHALMLKRSADAERQLRRGEDTRLETELQRLQLRLTHTIQQRVALVNWIEARWYRRLLFGKLQRIMGDPRRIA